MESFLARFGYAAVFGALLAGGLGIPVPEELTQLTAGVLAHEGILDLRAAIPIAWAGIVAGDAVLFLLARRAGPKVLAWRPVARALTPPRREWLDRHFARHAFLTVVVARHAGGLRFPTFALAGATGVRLSTFLAADGLSATVSVPLVVGAGYLLWHHLGQARWEIRIVELAALAVAAIGIAVAIRVRRRRGPRGSPVPGDGEGR